MVVDFEFGQYEIEPGEQADYEEEYQWVGEGEQEAGAKVAPVVGCGRDGCLECPCGVLTEKIQAESSKDDTAYDLYAKLMGVDKSGDETEAETGEETVDKVAERCAYTGKKSRPTAFAQSALYHEHTDRSHRGGNQSPDSYSSR